MYANKNKFDTLNLIHDNDNIDQKSDSKEEDEINLDIIDYKSGIQYIHKFPVPFNSHISNQKRLICYSIINNEQCPYKKNCTYAHNLMDQKIADFKIKYQNWVIGASYIKVILM